MRYVVVQDEKLKALLEQKKSLIDEGKLLEEEARKIDEKRSKIILKVGRLDSKAQVILKNYTTETLGEFETYGELKNVDGELHMEIIDQVEKFKETYKQVMAERNGTVETAS